MTSHAITSRDGSRVKLEPFRADDPNPGIDVGMGPYTVTVDAGAIAAALDGIVPGFTASYTAPMPPLPTERGRVIKTRGAFRGDRSIIWLNTAGGWRASVDETLTYTTAELCQWIIDNADGEFEVIL